MEFSLGVSMTPTAVRLVLVEGATADGASIDHFGVPAGDGVAQRVVAAILGTRESVEEGGHQLVSIGVAWTDHASAAELRRALRVHGGEAGIADSVVLVSELHAAGSLAQAIGRVGGYERTALLFLDGSTATLAVVRTADGAVVRVHTRGLAADDSALLGMVDRLDALDEAPQALYLIGAHSDSERLRAAIAERTSLPVHAPDDAELAMARGAALASANTSRWEAATVGLAPDDDETQAAPDLTERAGAGYMAPLGYSAVPDDPADSAAGLSAESGAESDAGSDDVPEGSGGAEPGDASEQPSFLLVGSALAALFVIGMATLVIALVVTIRPAVEQRPDPGPEALTNSQAPEAVLPPSAPETIQAPTPVVQEMPRTVFVTPAPARPPAAPEPAAAPMPEVVAPAPAPAAVPAGESVPVPAAPAPVPVPAAAPVPIPVPIVVPIAPPVLPQAPLPSIRWPVRPPSATPSVPSVTSPATSPENSPATSAETPSSTQAPVTSAAVPAAPVTTPQAPAASGSASSPESAPTSGSGSASSGSGSASASSSGRSRSSTSQSPLWPYWPPGR